MKPVADQWYQKSRLGGLRRFATAITVFNLLGHTVFGFEQSWAQPFVALATGYSLELFLEWIHARTSGQPPRFRGGFLPFVNFLLPAHISGLAVSMLLYSNDRLWPTVFATAVAIGSKTIFRVLVNGHYRHVFNPSNIGITITLLLFPWVGIAPPYHFTENLGSIGDWILPGIIVASGTFLNTRFTRRLPLITGWLGGFAAQAVVRHMLFGTQLTAALLPMTGVAFILYTFYMVTDPPTTPGDPKRQFAFGASVAAMYGLLMTNHIVFGLFFALSIVCAARGAFLYALAWARQGEFVPTVVAAPAPASVVLAEVADGPNR